MGALLLVPELAAQGRGTLQVAARVVAIRPHQEALQAAAALAGGRGDSGAPPAAGRSFLAAVRVEALAPEAVGRPGRRVVTVSFIRN